MKKLLRNSFNAFTLTLLTLGSVQLQAQTNAAKANIVNTNISESEVEAAQKAWGAALIQISEDHKKSGQKKAKATAKMVIEKAYGYNLGPVLFKPTLASGDQTFRTTSEGALAYFVGGDKKFPNDSGFALKGWKNYTFKNAAIFINADMALTMGHVILTDSNGNITTVDKTWGFKKTDDGSVRIVLHHSSLPFQANPTP